MTGATQQKDRALALGNVYIERKTSKYQYMADTELWVRGPPNCTLSKRTFICINIRVRFISHHVHATGT